MANKVPFNPAKDRLRVPEGREKEFEAYMDKLATLFNPVVWDDKNNRPVLKEDGKTLLGKDPSRPASNLVPPNWRDKQGKGEFDGDYDYVAAFLAGAEPGINPGDNAWHMGDVGKMPNHESFSVESYYARDPRWAPYAGRWEGETYIPPKSSEVHQDAKGGDSPGSETAVSETAVSESAPQVQGGPRIVINPTTFKNKKDALCVAFNEGFRLWMEANDFQPRSEPTDRQRKFFSDTAYADDELQLRRTILARVATFDTSVKDPTDDQLAETAQFLDGVLESGWCKNEWEQDCVSRLSQAVKAAIGAEPVEPKEGPLEPAQAEPLGPAGGEEVQALQSGGSTDDEEEDKFALQNAGKSFAVDRVEAQDLKRREAELEASLGMTPPEGQERAQELAGDLGAPTVQAPVADAPQAGKPAESDEPTDEQVQREAGRPKLTLASPVDFDSQGSIAYKGSRSGDIREPIVSSDSQGSIAFAFGGTRPGGIEDSIVSSDSQGSIAGAALDYAPGSIESPVDDQRRKEERRKRRDRRRRGLL